jgi:hypothetical protein
LISQFTAVVIASPLGSRRTPMTALKSICAIMGKIIAQIRMAMGMDTWAYSKRDRVSGTEGASCPRTTPATMARATQTDSYRSTSPMPPATSSNSVTSVLLIMIVLYRYWVNRGCASWAFRLPADYRSLRWRRRELSGIRLNFLKKSDLTPFIYDVAGGR